MWMICPDGQDKVEVLPSQMLTMLQPIDQFSFRLSIDVSKKQCRCRTFISNNLFYKVSFLMSLKIRERVCKAREINWKVMKF